MIQAKVEIFPLAQVFRISRGARTQAEVVTVIYEKDGIIGRGECVPYARYNDCLLYTSPSPRDGLLSRMPSSA